MTGLAEQEQGFFLCPLSYTIINFSPDSPSMDEWKRSKDQ